MWSIIQNDWLKKATEEQLNVTLILDDAKLDDAENAWWCMMKLDDKLVSWAQKIWLSKS